ncbi:GNAT family N-acetyltransferase [Flavobacterium sp. JP2137]|uniref:GNAT family N-acetyltransferase n=1 Tax=Flavobacterium sp. JP2137 TaxID=3414510 RepID=UPI003D2F9FFA
MNRIHSIDNTANLLLNLLLRETNSGYFFKDIPQYDEALAHYMQWGATEGFIRFESAVTEALVYFPLTYYSMTGMHGFGDRPCCRSSKNGCIALVEVDVAIGLITAACFHGFNPTALPAIYAQLEAEYVKAIALEGRDLCTGGQLMAAENRGSSALNRGDSHETSVESTRFISGSGSDIGRLNRAIKTWAANQSQPLNTAARQWVTAYANQLLTAVVKSYLVEGRVEIPNVYAAEMTVDATGLPTAVRFTESALLIRIEGELPPHKRRQVEDFLLTQLSIHHLYPLIRAVAFAGLTDENTLLQAVSKVVDQLKGQYGHRLDFLHGAHLKARAILPEVISLFPESSYESKQLHLHNYLINSSYYAVELIKPNAGAVVHKRYFNEGSSEISIRGFDMRSDLHVIHDWVNRDYSKRFWEMDGPIQDLEQAYIKHLGVDYSHPYIGLLNGEPIFTLELYWAIKDEVGKYYPFHPGDYGFHLLMAPAKQRIPRFSYHALSLCMEYFFSFPQVNRMIGEAAVDHHGTHRLITQVGCAFDSALVLPYKTSNLTFLTREMFQHTQRYLAEHSCREIEVNL